MRDIGKNIRDLRERSSMTQEALAEKLFVTRQTVSNYETGKTRPDLDMLIRIAETLGTDANTVLYGIPQSPERKRFLRQLTITASIFLFLLILDLVLRPIAKNYLNRTYLSGPSVVVNLFLSPLFWTLAGFFLTNLGKMVLKIQPKLPVWAKWVCIAVLSLWGIGFLLLFVSCCFHIYGDILAMTQNSVSLSLSFGKLLDAPAYWFLWITLHAPPLWLLPGFLASLLRPQPKASGNA